MCLYRSTYHLMHPGLPNSVRMPCSADLHLMCLPLLASLPLIITSLKTWTGFELLSCASCTSMAVRNASFSLFNCGMGATTAGCRKQCMLKCCTMRWV